MTALRRWPDEFARISDKELASRIGVAATSISGLLQNNRRWRATETMLRHARGIIEACGGTPEDLRRWTQYHLEVVAYQVTGGQLPTPPAPSWLPVPLDVRRAELIERLFGPRSQPLLAGAELPPSAWLNPRTRAMPFAGRESEFTQLTAWCGDNEAATVRLLHGPGGTGKTRLAVELARWVTDTGGLGGLLPVAAAGRQAWPARWELLEQAGKLNCPVLLVLDYAEARSAEVADLIEHFPPNALERLRVLLLARHPGHWVAKPRPALGRAWAKIRDRPDTVGGRPVVGPPAGRTGLLGVPAVAAVRRVP